MMNIRKRVLDADAALTQLGKLGRMSMAHTMMPEFQIGELAQLVRPRLILCMMLGVEGRIG